MFETTLANGRILPVARATQRGRSSLVPRGFRKRHRFRPGVESVEERLLLAPAHVQGYFTLYPPPWPPPPAGDGYFENEGQQTANGTLSESTGGGGTAATFSGSASADFSTVRISEILDATAVGTRAGPSLAGAGVIVLEASRADTIYLPTTPSSATVNLKFSANVEPGSYVWISGRPGNIESSGKYIYTFKNIGFGTKLSWFAESHVNHATAKSDSPDNPSHAHLETSASLTLTSIKVVDPVQGEIDPKSIFFGSRLGDTPPPGPGPVPDIVATSLAWDPDCGLDFHYDIRNAPLPRETTIAVYWAGGTTLDSIIGAPIDVEPSQTAVGSYSIHLGCSTLGTPPPGATDVVVVVDPPTADKPSGEVAEADEADGGQSNNTLALPLPNSATTTTLTSSINPSVYGQEVTFTATVNAVTPEAGTPTGQVIFLDNGNFLGRGDLNATVATFKTADLIAGDHDITAQYVGDGQFNPGNSNIVVQTVAPAIVDILISLSPDPSVYGQMVTITGTLSVRPSGSGQPTGSITLLDGTDPIRGYNLGPGETGAKFDLATLRAGTHQITVLYTPDNNNFTSSASSANLAIDKARLAVKADELQMAHGAPLPALTWTYTGFVNGDTAAAVRGAPNLSTNATSSSPAGHYPIDIAVGSLAADNYTFQLVPGTLTVHPRVLDIRVHYGTKRMSLLDLNRDLPFANITAIDAVFSDDVLASISSLALNSTTPSGPSYGIRGFNYEPSAHVATWTLPTALGIDRLVASLDKNLGAEVDTSIKVMGTRNWNFAVLPGDYDGDGAVTISDALAIRNQTPGFIAAGTVPSAWADLDGDGVVDINDVNLAKARVGKKLPPP